MQTKNLANNSYKKFYALLNTNQIKLCTYPDLLKENPLLRKLLPTGNQQLNFQMRPFTTRIYYFSQRGFLLQQSLKPQNTACITSFIIHMTQQLNIQSSALKNVKLSHLVGSVDKNNVYFQMICLFPRYWKLPVSHTFVEKAVKHKKL